MNRRLFLLSSLPAVAQTDRTLEFLRDHTDYRNLRNQLGELERARAFALLDQREARVAKWTRSDAEARKAYVRDRLTKALGGFPERTPLNPKVTGTLTFDGYRIEKIVFESQPSFFVTANLYVPSSGSGPFPAILFPLGHEDGAKAHSAWQQLLVSFVRRGYVCFAWDTIGQGERVQLYDEDFEASKVIRSTTEHTITGTQTLVSGESFARYTIWDGIRALDYLAARPEVDPKRIGCTGNSGGGTHTAYLSALDDRIAVAAPSCYITSWRRLLQTIGPQDAEQCIPPMLADGLDHPDFIHAFAPKPYLILSAVRDFFSITGARESYTEAQRVYELFNAPDRIAMVEADDGHGYTQPRRVAAYRWFDRWLKGTDPGEVTEQLIQPLREDELWATATGQVQTSLGGETVFTLNRTRSRAFRRGTVSPDDIRQALNYEKPGGALRAKPFGAFKRPGFQIEKLTYLSEAGMEIPALFYLPEGQSRKPAAIYAHGRGKSAATADIESLVGQGVAVLSIDLRGFGETRQASDDNGSDWPRYFGDYASGMTSLLCGRTLVSGRVRDIVRAIDLLETRPEIDPQRIYGTGVEAAGVAMLHAAALDTRLRRVALERTLESYQSVTEFRINRGVFENVVPRALRAYDLPDLARLLAPRPLAIIDAADPVGMPSALDRVRKLYPSAKVSRRSAGDAAVTLFGFSA